MSRRLLLEPSARYRDAVLALAPTGYWPLDDGAGTKARDLSGGGNTGTLTGGILLNQAPLVDGPCMSFDGIAGSVITTANTVFNATTNLSIALWMRHSGNPGAAIPILGKYANTAAGFDLNLNTTGKLRLTVRGTSSIDGNNIGGVVTDGRPHFVVFAVSPTAVTVYIDGAAGASTAGTWTATTVSANFLIGQRQTAEAGFNSALSHVAIWVTKTLSASEMTSLYSAAFG